MIRLVLMPALPPAGATVVPSSVARGIGAAWGDAGIAVAQ
jgi:hypothetical protein